MLGTDLKYYKTSNNLGGAITATELNGALEDVFANTSSAEALAGKVEYACFYIKNTHGADLASAVKHWILSNTPNAKTEDKIGLGTSGVDGTEQLIVDKNTKPTGVTFSTAADEANCLSLPNLAAGKFHAIWIERTTTAGATGQADDVTSLRTKADTI